MLMPFNTERSGDMTEKHRPAKTGKEPGGAMTLEQTRVQGRPHGQLCARGSVLTI